MSETSNETGLGTIEVLSTKNKSIKVNDKWYKFSSKTKGASFESLKQGSTVEFSFKAAEHEGFVTNWLQGCKEIITEETPPGKDGGSQPGAKETPQKADYWDNKERYEQNIGYPRMVRMNALTHATETCKSGGKPFATDLVISFASDYEAWIRAAHPRLTSKQIFYIEKMVKEKLQGDWGVLLKEYDFESVNDMWEKITVSQAKDIASWLAGM